MLVCIRKCALILIYAELYVSGSSRTVNRAIIWKQMLAINSDRQWFYVSDHFTYRIWVWIGTKSFHCSALKEILKVIRYVPLPCNHFNPIRTICEWLHWLEKKFSLAVCTNEIVCLVLTHHGCASSIIYLAANVSCFLDHERDSVSAKWNVLF